MSPPHDPAHGTLHPAPGPRTRRSSAVMPLGRVRRCWRHPRLARGRENLAGGAALETVRSPGCRTGTALVDGRFRTRAGLETVRSPGCRTGTALVDGRFRTRAGHRVR